MSATTKWRDTQAESFDEVLQKMTSAIENDSRTNSSYRINFSTKKILENNSYIILNNERIKYNIIRYAYDQISVQDDLGEDRVIRKNGFIVIFEHVGAIYYIVDQNNTAKRLLRKMLGYTGKNEIKDSNFDFKEDFFVWLVNRAYNLKGVIENTFSNDNKLLKLEEIKGIRGNTEDLQTKVTTSGESVMNVISTLSFLLESRKLNQVILNLSYTGHENICIKLQNPTMEIIRPYNGEFANDIPEEMYAKLYLLLHLEILPLLEKEYRMNKNEGLWNQQAYVDFLTGIKDTIINKIEKKIQFLTHL